MKLPIMQKDIKQSWFFTQSPQEVWEYLTKPELIEQWLLKTDFKPVKGHKFQFTFIPKENSKYDGTVDCEVLEVIPFTKLSYSWNGKTNDSRTFNSKVEWRLIPKESGTELQLQHNGFTVMEDIINHGNGWNACLKRFEELINTIQ
jgi:uncharacterized protein YndB with AHSA1/START domain